MNITFFIGNGFDLNLGLKTKYSHFYPYFIDNASENNMIRKWLNEDELLWADLEERLGQRLQCLKKEELEKFYSDKAELDSLLLEYLEQEQRKINTNGNENAIIEEIVRSMKTFSSNLAEKERESINATCDLYKNQHFKYCFISFNYTNILDEFLEITRKSKTELTSHLGDYNVKKMNYLGNVLHIHGTLKEEMILGVNDAEQINNDFLKTDDEFLDTFIKRRMNDSIGQRKTEHVKEVIEESHIICVFGMSIGSSDKMWWEELVSWLNRDTTNKLIIYYKGLNEKLNRKLPANIVRANNNIKKEIIEKGRADIADEEIEKIKKRIFISFNADIFNFKAVKK